MFRFQNQSTGETLLEFDLRAAIGKTGEPVRFALVPLQQDDLNGVAASGYRRYLAGMVATKFCHIAFSMNAQLHSKSDVRDIFKKQPETIKKALGSAAMMIPSVTDHKAEEGQSTFVLDMNKGGSYQDDDTIGKAEQMVADFLRTKMSGDESGDKMDLKTQVHVLIRPWMTFFIAEGTIKCKVVKAMTPEQREWVEGTEEGRIKLCMMGLVVIHTLQCGFRLVHEASGVDVSPTGVFFDLDENPAPEVDDVRELFKRNAHYTTIVMFPGQHYSTAYSAESDYFLALRDVCDVLFVRHSGHGECSVRELGANERTQIERTCKIDLLDTAPSVLGVLSSFDLTLGCAGRARTSPSDSPSSKTPTELASITNGVANKKLMNAIEEVVATLPPCEGRESALAKDIVGQLVQMLCKKRPYDPAQTIFGGDLRASSLSVEEKVELVRCVCENGGELVGDGQLTQLFQDKMHPVCYDGFEPSGRVHIAQGVLKAVNVNRLTKAGCVFVFWVADWFGLLNNKMGGDLEKIQTVGRYFVEVWKSVGMDMQNVRFLWAADEINKNSDRYWLLVLNIARSFNITRIKRCSQIMGRQEGDEQPAASIMYPCMQCADVFYLGADICQLGLDQRKVNMLAREFLERPECKESRDKPIIASHGMIPGLKGQEKMSKSDPDSAIFMEDDVADVERKVQKALCPEKQVEGNPCVAYVRMLVFPKDGQFVVHRSPKHGDDIVFASPDSFEEAYKSGSVHPADLKKNLADTINRMLAPVREHFQSNPQAAQLLAKVRQYRVTR